MRIKYFLIIGFITLFSCKYFPIDQTYGVAIRNNTDSTVVTISKYNTFHKINILDYDTLSFMVYKVNAKKLDIVVITDDEPKFILGNTDTISIFILDKEEYEGKTWKQIVDSAKFKQIYHLSGDDIRRLGSKIPYPPTEIMRDMDIIPKYGEQEETD